MNLINDGQLTESVGCSDETGTIFWREQSERGRTTNYSRNRNVRDAMLMELTMAAVCCKR